MTQPRKIVIETCGTCHHRDHRGGFGRIAYIPYCGKTGNNLPYTTHSSKHGTMVTASLNEGIPDWCPLPLNKEPSPTSLLKLSLRQERKGLASPPPSIDPSLCKQASAIRHSHALNTIINQAREDFLRALNTIDPTFPWEIKQGGMTIQKDYLGADLTFAFYSIEYTRDAADLTHPNAVVGASQVALSLVHTSRVQNVRLYISLIIYSKLTPDHILTLRLCGAMREVTETHTNTRTIVQCEI